MATCLLGPALIAVLLGGAAQAAARAKATEVPTQADAGDPLGGRYGDVPLVASGQTSGSTWTPIQELTAAKDGEMVRRTTEQF